MSLTRASRFDRRRRSMREAIAAESGVAVEAVRARARRRSEDSDQEEHVGMRRDPGYSQEVRFACQQRLVQLIPVRRSTMASVIAALVSVWAALMLAHYIVNVRGTSLSGLAIAHFFHIRSPHSVSHWLGSQLWMFTGIVSLLIFQLRRHKLDDYRAKYRIWLFLAAGAAFSSFDASTSALYILGTTIDPWTQKQFSLAGWPVVLASFAALVGVLGLRLCTELKSSPGSVSLWLLGLASWAFSAVLGTGLFKTDLSPAMLDMTVGATWLGGILSVFLASTLYLRHIYIQAQKRFALRNKWLAERQKWQMPKMSLEHLNPKRMAQGLTSKLRRKERVSEEDLDEESSAAHERPTKNNASSKTNSSSSDAVVVATAAASAALRSDASSASYTQAGRSSSGSSPSRNNAGDSANPPEIPTAEKRSFFSRKPKTAPDADNTAAAETKPKGSWLPWKRSGTSESTEVEANEYSDVGAFPRARDRGLNSGFEKVGQQASRDEDQAAESVGATRNATNGNKATSPSTEQKTSRGWLPFRNKAKDASSPQTTSSSKTAAAKTSLDQDGNASDPAMEKKRSWSMGMFKRSNKAPKAPKEISGSESTKKRSLFSRKPKEDLKPAATKSATSQVDKQPTGKKKSSWFGIFDALTLKPPTAAEAASPKSQPQVSIPSTSSQSSPARAPQQAPLANHGQAVSGNFDDDDDDSSDNRNLSKAERKRLRRQQQNRAA